MINTIEEGFTQLESEKSEGYPDKFYFNPTAADVFGEIFTQMYFGKKIHEKVNGISIHSFAAHIIEDAGLRLMI